MTTTNLTRRRRTWYDLPTPIAAAICLSLLIMIGLAVGRYKSLHQAAAAPTPVVSYIIIASPVPVPTATLVSAPPTPDERVYQELAALREQVTQLQAAQQAQPQPQPEVVYQPVYVANEQPAEQPPAAAPTPTEQEYQAASVPAEAPTAAPVVQASEFKEPDPQARCAFVGCLR